MDGTFEGKPRKTTRGVHLGVEECTAAPPADSEVQQETCGRRAELSRAEVRRLEKQSSLLRSGWLSGWVVWHSACELDALALAPRPSR